MPRTLNAAASASAALTAFLRGVERRGAVFAQLQVGDADTGDRALVAAMRAFRLPAVRLPMADWPRQFWTLLLATRELREAPANPHWGSGFGSLARVGRGPRAALLLRLVAGLAEAEAAAVLGVARPTYRLALQRALPHRDDGQPDAEGWRMLGEASQHAVRALSVERLAQLARMREAVILGRKFETAARPTPAPARGDSPARWRWPAMAVVAVVTLLAFAGSFFLPPPVVDPAAESRIDVRALPPAQAPKATFNAQAALLTHPDFDLLLDADDHAAAHDPGFYAWLAAGAKPGPAPASPDDTPAPDNAAAPGHEAPATAASESEDVP